MRIFLTGALLLFFSLNALAQGLKFEPGFIIRNNDTIPGFIQKTSESDLSRQVIFKINTESSSEESYNPETISGFGFSTTNTFFKAVPVEVKSGEEPHDFKIVTRFGKALLAGPNSLFKIQFKLDEQATRFLHNNTYRYVLQTPDNYYTLYQEEINQNTTFKVNKQYIGVLRSLFFDCRQLVPIMDKLVFEDEDFIRLMKRINDCKYPNSTSKEFTHNVPAIFSHHISLSGMYNYPFGRDYDMEIDFAYGLKLGYYLSVTEPDLSTQTSFNVGLSYSIMDYNMHETTTVQIAPDKVISYKYYYTGPWHSVQVPVFVQTTAKKPLFRNGKVYPYLQGGITPYFSLGSNYPTFDAPLMITLRAGIGLTGERWSAGLANEGRFLQANVAYRLNK